MGLLIVTFAVAMSGSVTAAKLKVPAGTMVGSMIAVAVFNIAFGSAYFPAGARFMTQMISGLFIGCKITRREIAGLRTVLRPALINTFVLLTACMLMGIVMYIFTDYSLATCVFACAPGSMVDMSVIALDMAADTSVVSVLQLVRLLSILGLFPTLFRLLITKMGESDSTGNAISEASAMKIDSVPADKGGDVRKITMTFICAFAGAVIGGISAIPAGTLIFSLAAVSIQNVAFDNAYMPIKLKQFAQICAGALIGESVTREAVVGLRYAIVPAFLMITCLLIIVVGLAFLLYRMGGIDFCTALFACAPGGASDLALIAEDFGASTPKISIIQYMRVISVVVFYPSVIQMLSRILDQL